MKKLNLIKEAWLVLLLALVYAAALAGVETAVKGRIALNQKNETYDVIPDLVEGAAKQATEEVALTDAAGEERTVYKAINEQGEPVGWVIPASGQGFAGTIRLLVGVDHKVETITGIYVLQQVETPGLGDYITEDYFRQRFEGAPADPGRPIEIVKGEAQQPHQVKALTGATVSSRSVADIVNNAIDNLEAQQLHQVKALTGATVSSRSVADIVNNAIDNLEAPLNDRTNAND